MGLEFNDYENENGGKVSAAIVDDDTAGTVVRRTDGQTYETKSGDVLVTAYRPQEYDVFSQGAAEEFTKNYKKSGGETTELPDSSEGDEIDFEEFDPSERNASEVREYLSRSDISNEERSRVIDAERAGKNRATAFPA